MNNRPYHPKLSLGIIPSSMDLKEAERFGTIFVRHVCLALLEKQDLNLQQLLFFAKGVLEAADNANCRNDKEMTASYLYLYHDLWEYAKCNLNSADYHTFCGNQIDWWEYLFTD